MTTTFPDYVWRVEVTATKPNPGTEVKRTVFIPDGVIDLTIYAKGSAAAACKIEESPSTPAQIGEASGDTWMSVDASLDAVGTTFVRYPLGTRTPVALRVSSLTDNQTATMVVVGKRVR